MMTTKRIVIVLSILLATIGGRMGVVQASPHTQIPVPGLPTLLDLGATACVPCKLMAPILEKLEKQYRGRAAIIFIDVWQYPDQAKRFGIRTIPTQIFFRSNGEEAFRHEGFLGETEIVRILEHLGAGGARPASGQPVASPPGPTAPVSPVADETESRYWILAVMIAGFLLLGFGGWYRMRIKKRRQNLVNRNPP